MKKVVKFVSDWDCSVAPTLFSSFHTRNLRSNDEHANRKSEFQSIYLRLSCFLAYCQTHAASLFNLQSFHSLFFFHKSKRKWP